MYLMVLDLSPADGRSPDFPSGFRLYWFFKIIASFLHHQRGPMTPERLAWYILEKETW